MLSLVARRGEESKLTCSKLTNMRSCNHSASQEIPRLLWNPNVYYRVHNSTPLFPILN